VPQVANELVGVGLGKGAQTSRGMIRQELILKVAANLFSERGYDSVSINDIGFAAGVTGPAIYRYFPSKEALLVSIYEHLYRRWTDGLAGVLADEGPGRAAVERLVDLQIDLAAGEAEKIRIITAEDRHLPPDAAAHFAAENRRRLRICTDLIRQVRPDLSRDELDATVHALLAMINSISLKSDPESVSVRVRQHLREMALSLIFTGDPLGVSG
jgi:AcrR family transcriptional regulator